MLELHERPRALPQWGSAVGGPRLSHWLSPSALILSMCGPGFDGSPARGRWRVSFSFSGSAPAASQALTSVTTVAQIERANADRLCFRGTSLLAEGVLVAVVAADDQVAISRHRRRRPAVAGRV